MRPLGPWGPGANCPSCPPAPPLGGPACVWDSTTFLFCRSATTDLCCARQNAKLQKFCNQRDSQLKGTLTSYLPLLLFFFTASSRCCLTTLSTENGMAYNRKSKYFWYTRRETVWFKLMIIEILRSAIDAFHKCMSHGAGRVAVLSSRLEKFQRSAFPVKSSSLVGQKCW